MKNKIIPIIEILSIIITIILAICFKFFPEYKKTLGSSDSFINTSSYQDIIEIKINSTPDFAVVTSTDNKITNILFFDKKSACLYNKSIENKVIETAIEKTIKILIENDYIRSHDTITLTQYNGTSYRKVKSSISSTLENLGVQFNFIEEKKTLKEKAKELDLDDTSEESLIRLIDIYSKGIIRNYKNDTSSSDNLVEELTEETAKQYANNVYKKIETYILEKNITSQEISNTDFSITLIPADSKGNYYPNSNSWYYIKLGKVYAYISFTSNDTTYSYCYQGSIDEYKKGEC